MAGLNASTGPDWLLETRLIVISAEADVFAARVQARTLAAAMGFSPAAALEIETAVSELAGNVWYHGGGGRVWLRREGRRLAVTCLDRGPGFSGTAGRRPHGLGIGLAGAARLMRHLEFGERPGGGAWVHAWRSVEEDAPDDPASQRGAASQRSGAGETGATGSYRGTPRRRGNLQLGCPLDRVDVAVCRRPASGEVVTGDAFAVTEEPPLGAPAAPATRPTAGGASPAWSPAGGADPWPEPAAGASPAWPPPAAGTASTQVDTPSLRRLLFTVADGLGHGEAAAEASERVCATIGAMAGAALPQALEAAHHAARTTRGAVAGLLRLADDGHRLTAQFAGVGNVTLTVWSPPAAYGAPAPRRFTGTPGCLGVRYTGVAVEILPAPVHVLLLTTDGAEASLLRAFDGARRMPLHSARRLAELIVLDADGRDDATALAVVLRGARGRR